MRTCPICSAEVHRTHRRGWQRLYYSALYACQRCGDVPVHRFRLPPALRFVFSWQTHCVRCGNKVVRQLPKRDGIDSVSRHPLSILMGLAGAPWRHCERCRLQYRDWRPDAVSRLQPSPQGRS